MSKTTLGTVRTIKGKSFLTVEPALNASYKNDLVVPMEFTVNPEDGTPERNFQVYFVVYTSAASAAAMNTAGSGYEKFPNGSLGYCAGDTRTLVKKGIGSGWGLTDGTWV